MIRKWKWCMEKVKGTRTHTIAHPHSRVHAVPLTRPAAPTKSQMLYVVLAGNVQLRFLHGVQRVGINIEHGTKRTSTYLKEIGAEVLDELHKE